MLLSNTVCCSLLLFAAFAAGDLWRDRITSLPGLLDNITFVQYAGYIHIVPSIERKLFYWLVLATEDPYTKPLILWLTGGPGCSSLLALLLENGPFTPNPGGKVLFTNPYSWNNLANVLYVESPAGVGFSSSKVSTDYTVGDARTTSDLVLFLQLFFDNNPKLMEVPFYIAGESYGGHYVPNLALAILKMNLLSQTQFRGILVGNPWTYPNLDNNGTTLFWFSHGLMTVEQFQEINKCCNFSVVGPGLSIVYADIFENKKCSTAIDNANKIAGFINPYDIYDDVCMRTRHYEGEQLVNALLNKERVIKKIANKYQYNDNPCGTEDAAAYLNRADVQNAIHADPTKWVMCSEILHYSKQDVLTPMKTVWEQLIPNYKQLKFLVYSGDVDAIVPWLGTILWIKDLEKDGAINLTKDWSPWYGSTKQVGGFTLEYDKMTFKTVREAGHQVPMSQPYRAFDLLNDFLNETMN